MLDGNVSQDTPVDNGVPPGEDTGNGQEGSENTSVDYKAKHAESSREAHRLVEANKALEARLAALEAASKSKEVSTEDHVQQFPDEDSYVNHWVNNGDKSEKEARQEYRLHKTNFENQTHIWTYVKALENRLKFESEQREKGLTSNNPLAQEAVEYFKDIPEFDSLPITEKIDRMNKLKERSGIKSSGRDLSSVKASASSPIGGASGSNRTVAATPELDAMAKSKGYPHYRAMQEVTNCKTQQEYAAVKAKYKIQ